MNVLVRLARSKETNVCAYIQVGERDDGRSQRDMYFNLKCSFPPFYVL